MLEGPVPYNLWIHKTLKLTYWFFTSLWHNLGWTQNDEWLDEMIGFSQMLANTANIKS